MNPAQPMSAVSRARFIDEIDAVADYIRMVELAVVGLSESGGVGPLECRALRTVLMGLTERVERLREAGGSPPR